MKKTTWLAVALALLSMTAFAQENENKDAKTTLAKAAEAPKFYRLEWKMSEFDGAKLIASRTYVTTSRDGEYTRTRTGNRVPVATKGGNGPDWQYIDVGMNIDYRVRETAGTVWVESNNEFTSLPADANTASSAPPIVRQVKAQGWVQVQYSKTAVVFTFDDPTTTHRFQLEVTVTPQK